MQIDPTEMMQFLTIVRFEALEETLSNIYPDFSVNFTAVYMKKIAQNAERFPKMKEFADAILKAHAESKEEEKSES